MYININKDPVADVPLLIYIISNLITTSGLKAFYWYTSLYIFATDTYTKKLGSIRNKLKENGGPSMQNIIFLL